MKRRLPVRITATPRPWPFRWRLVRKRSDPANDSPWRSYSDGTTRRALIGLEPEVLAKHPVWAFEAFASSWWHRATSADLRGPWVILHLESGTDDRLAVSSIYSGELVRVDDPEATSRDGRKIWQPPMAYGITAGTELVFLTFYEGQVGLPANSPYVRDPTALLVPRGSCPVCGQLWDQREERPGAAWCEAVPWDRIVAWLCTRCSSWWRLQELGDTAIEAVAEAAELDLERWRGEAMRSDPRT